MKTEAFELLKRVGALDPTNLQNRLSLADLMAREGMTDQAREEYQSLLSDLERRGDFEGLERARCRSALRTRDALAVLPISSSC